VCNGGTATNTTISGGRQEVFGSATSTTISGGRQDVYNGGTVTSTTISGGWQNVFGSATSTTISGGTQNVCNGGTVTNTTISGGEQWVWDGGTATSTTLSGGTQWVWTSGSATHTMISGGVQRVDGSSTSTTLSGGTQLVNGTATSTTINGGEQDVYNGGTATNTTISGGTQWVNGSATSTTVDAGGVLAIASGGRVTDATLQAGYVLSASTDSILAANSGGTVVTISGGTAKNLTLNRDGVLDVNDGGTAMNTTINSGGLQRVRSGGTASDTNIQYGGTQHILTSGTALRTTVQAGGTQTIETGGTANGIVIYAGAVQIVSAGAITSNIQNIGNQSVDSGGSDYQSIIQAGAIQNVAAGAIVDGTQVYGTQNVAGTANTVTVETGGVQAIQSGGRATAATILRGGTQNVQAGGAAWQASVSGRQNIAGTAALTTIASGGTQTIQAGGQVSSATIQSGGTQFILSGGTAADITASTGAVLNLQTGGALHGMTTLTQANLNLQGGPDVYNIDGLSVSGGAITLSQEKTTGSQLTIGSLAGSANFIINTDLAQNRADHITIQSTSGTVEHTLQVGYDPGFLTGKTISGNAEFAIVPDQHTTFRALPTETGAYAYTPVLAANTAGTVWSIRQLVSDKDTPLPRLQPSETMYTASDTLANNLTLWRSENNSMTKRMGELRHGSGDAGIWTRIYKGEEELKDVYGRRSTQQYTAFQGGWDKRLRRQSGTWYRGAAIGYLQATDSMKRGSGDSSSLSFGVYSSWLGDDGHFLDIIAKQSRLRNHYTDYLNNALNTAVTGNYANWGSSLSMEYGYRKKLPQKWYLEPQAELCLGRISSARYVTSDGTRVYNPNVYSLTGRIGFAVGRSLRTSTFYAKASMIRELRARANVIMQTGALSPMVMEQDLRESYLEFAIGMTGVLDKGINAYLEIDKTTGDKVRTPWMINFGIRKSF